jgi:hypothetical protein
VKEWMGQLHGDDTQTVPCAYASCAFAEQLHFLSPVALHVMSCVAAAAQALHRTASYALMPAKFAYSTTPATACSVHQRFLTLNSANITGMCVGSC